MTISPPAGVALPDGILRVDAPASFSVRVEVQGGNVTNRVVFCDPYISGTQNFSAGNFGQVSLQCNQPRSVQFGMKFEY